MSIFEKFKFISCETSPNFVPSDAFLAFKLLFFPWLEQTKNSENLVDNWFSKYLNLSNNKYIFQTNSGRTALYLLLKSLNLPSKSEILIQGFSCVLVPNAVLQAGYRPIICEIEGNTFNFDLDQIQTKISTKTRVWIVQHTFGLMPDMQKIKEICNKYDLILIEDCAHSLGSIQKEQKAGTLGDAAIFSFGRDKIVSSVAGGLAVINNNNDIWRQRLIQEYNKLPPISKRLEQQSLFFTILGGWFLPLYHLIIGKIALKISLLLKLIPDIYTKEEAKGTNLFEGGSKFSALLSTVLYKQLLNFDKSKIHRQKLALIYSKEFGIEYYRGSVYLRFPLNLEKISPNCSNYFELYNKILKKLRKEGIFAGLWYTRLFITPQADLTKFGYVTGSLPITERLLDYRVLNLPTNINTSIKDAQRIVSIIKSSLD